MNVVFELRVKSFRKLLKDVACLIYIRGETVPQNSRAVAEHIYLYYLNHNLTKFSNLIGYQLP